ncbi:hypothetical protein LC087_12135 [Bacillus carboniphilus]|uniref:Aminoglycoside phosphotransferase domain-containing protein n=1 Tax=Bacillus carboniphilus TaxID=86663 RepID=A0ABY9JT84_9BACI|nr:hypothetical protein [Bacillus carboniphilus]WLR41627.1 hypothetical protein LC087_12135 [Bacillus carboniphilus]
MYLEKRIIENNWMLLEQEPLSGLHAGCIKRLKLLDENKKTRILIYKEFAEDRNNEIEIYNKLLPKINKFLPVTHVWNEYPEAILMEDLGQPLKEIFNQLALEDKKQCLREILSKLAEVHTVSSQGLPVHQLSTEWYDWCCAQLERLSSLNLEWVDSNWIEVVKKMYEKYNIHNYKIKCPNVLTHGDPHLE